MRLPDRAGRDAGAALRFLNQRGIIPRETGGYGLPGCLRFTIGRENEMRATADAVGEFMQPS